MSRRASPIRDALELKRDTPVIVEEIKFNRARAQKWMDPWRQVFRICRRVGACVTCGRSTYTFDDGENDPRGALGDHADSGFCASDHGFPASLPDVPQCALCAQTEGSYKRGLEIAQSRWGRAR